MKPWSRSNIETAWTKHYSEGVCVIAFFLRLAKSAVAEALLS